MDARQREDGRRHTAVGYLRRSTNQQEQSIADQRAAIEQYAREHGTNVLRYYVDDAISGTRSDSRKAFQAMIADARRQGCPFGIIIVYDIKRFGRVDNDEAGHYRYVLRRCGVEPSARRSLRQLWSRQSLASTPSFSGRGVVIGVSRLCDGR